jgi:hypothetical protein
MATRIRQQLHQTHSTVRMSPMDMSLSAPWLYLQIRSLGPLPMKVLVYYQASASTSTKVNRAWISIPCTVHILLHLCIMVAADCHMSMDFHTAVVPNLHRRRHGILYNCAANDVTTGNNLITGIVLPIIIRLRGPIRSRLGHTQRRERPFLSWRATVCLKLPRVARYGVPTICVATKATASRPTLPLNRLVGLRRLLVFESRELSRLIRGQ